MPRWKWLEPNIFNLPVDEIRRRDYTDKYFVRAREVLVADGHHPRVTMQVFGKADAHLGGVDEAIAILKLCSASRDELTLHAFYNGG